MTGEESGDCVCRIEVRRLTGHALSLDYEAVGSDGLQHVEHTVITRSALHVVASELPDVVALRMTAPGRYVAGEGPLPREIHADWDGGSLTWAWHWSSPGEGVREQSRATVRAVG